MRANSFVRESRTPIDDDAHRCREIVRTHGRSFYLASLFLLPDQRRAIHAVYAFCRVADDIVDSMDPGRASETGHIEAIFPLGVLLERRGEYVEAESWYRRAAEACAKYLAKGRQIAVTGRLIYREWEADDGTRRSKHAVIGRVQFGGRPDNGDDPQDTDDDEVHDTEEATA